MTFSVKTVIRRIASDLNIPEATVEEFVSGELGTQWILERHLNCSEVELSMALKSIRKRLSFNLYYNFKYNLDKGQRTILFERLLSQYQKFNSFHSRFFKRKDNFYKIYEMLLPEIIILDSGISGRRFFQVLPQILKKINPYELDLYFAVNTLLRWYIAVFLQSKIKPDLYARGSLIFVNARSFGCGYLANFPLEVTFNNQNSTYFPLQGSDLDLRIQVSSSLVELKEKIRELIKEIRYQLVKYKTFLTIEITTFDENSKDDLWPVRDFPVLRKNLSELLSNSDKIKIERKDLYFKKKRASIGELKEKKFLRVSQNHLLETEGKIRLTGENIRKLRVAFQKILRYHKLNEDFINLYSIKWRHLLDKARRETNFYGLIAEKDLFSLFGYLFYLSGCRLSVKEKQVLFNEILREYEKTKV